MVVDLPGKLQGATVEGLKIAILFVAYGVYWRALQMLLHGQFQSVPRKILSESLPLYLYA